jgi:hypothetical protein
MPVEGIPAASSTVRVRDTYESEIAVMSAHLAALEAFVFPAACVGLNDGRSAVSPLRARVHRVERLMRTMEGRLRGCSQSLSRPIGDVHSQLSREFGALQDDEWLLASRLDSELTSNRRTRLLDAMDKGARRSPTRPHPFTPHSRGLARFTFYFCAAWDSVMDTMDGRIVPRQRPARTPRPAGRWGLFVLGSGNFEAEERIIESPRRQPL